MRTHTRKVKTQRNGIVLLGFRWHNGPYIDVFMDNVGEAFECINVWDYEKGEATMEDSRKGMQDTCGEWVAENRKDDPAWLDVYLENVYW